MINIKDYKKEYIALASAKTRCNNPNGRKYHRYGGRGITICERWMDSERGFENFLRDMGPAPSADHSLDRIDNNGNYDPANCRWATSEEQQSNRENNLRIEHNGETKTMAQWARALGICFGTLHTRIVKLGMSNERALTSQKYIEESRFKKKAGR